jgi:hypothetical protein
MVRFVWLCFGMLVRLFRRRQGLLFVRWHRAGFRMYSRLISRVRRQVGRKQTPKEIREVIFQMVAENPTWGAPRIHGELRMLGFDLSQRTVSRWMKRAPRGPDQAKRWLVFLRNHREAIAAMDTESIIVFTPTPPEPPRFGPRLKFWRTTNRESVVADAGIFAGNCGAWLRSLS